jgi:hypothetical protein
MSESEPKPALSRCAFCMRSGVFANMLHCIHCHATFCRGDCHSLYHRGAWEKMQEQAARP